MLKAMPQAQRQAMPAKQCRQDKTRLLTQQLLTLSSYLTFRNARRGGTTNPPKKVTHQAAAATRQAANHA